MNYLSTMVECKSRRWTLYTYSSRIILALLSTIAFASCISERMYLSVSDQSIISCTPLPIFKLEMKCTSSPGHYVIRWEDPNRPAPYKMHPALLDTGYAIYKDELELNARKFRLSPNTTYYLGLGRVDTSELCIMIKTDSTGKIFSGTPNICKGTK